MRRRAILITLSLVLIIGAVVFINGLSPSSSQLLFNGVEVEENTDLTYYLKVSYDGVDKYGVSSTTTRVSEVNSGVILIEDKIPNGLIFQSFVASSDGSIGAVEQSDPNKACLGKVIDDGDVTNNSYHGLHYNPDTRMVSFKIENLQAGCELTIGIKTKTPFLDDPNTPVIESRRDFYNFANLNEDDYGDTSETVHAYIGDENELLHKVNYVYTDAPEGAPALDNSNSYAKNSEVAVNLKPKLEGYEFVGWFSDDVEIIDDKFIMPANDVTLKGSFRKIDFYNVEYQIDGDVPDEYVLPSSKSYYPGSHVEIDSLKIGDVIGNYKFLGWQNDEIQLSDESSYFEMPNHNVIFKGKFEENKYKLQYKFYDTVLPPNYLSLLPADALYSEGEVVTLSEVSEVSGYEFLGWYSDETFVMPAEDVVIYGEWKAKNGEFSLDITKNVSTTKEYYRSGNIIKYKTTITNSNAFPINNVLVSSDVDNFIENGNYEVLDNKLVKIPIILANSTVELYSSYVVDGDDTNKITVSSEIIGALADNYELAEGQYKASVTSNLQSKIKICCYINGVDDNNVFQYLINGSGNTYNSSLVLSRNECKSIYVDPTNYTVQQIVPQEYELISVTGAATNNPAVFNVNQGQNYEVNFTNQFKKKGFFHSFGRIVNRIEQGD